MLSDSLLSTFHVQHQQTVCYLNKLMEQAMMKIFGC